MTAIDGIDKFTGPTLIKVIERLTHQIHVTSDLARLVDLREQRRIVEEEILRRMEGNAQG